MQHSHSDVLDSPWFAVYTAPRHEKQVQKHLQLRSVEHFLPVYTHQAAWKDGTRPTLQLPLFPSYLFVQIEKEQRSRVLQVPGVLAIVGGTGKEPATLDSTEIEMLRAGVQLRKVEPHPVIHVGQTALIRRGPFTGKSGIVVRKKGAVRVVLTLEVIMRSIAVECDLSDIAIMGNRAS